VTIIDRIAQRWSKLDQSTPVAKTPQIMMLEVTNACNLKCIMCAHANSRRPIGIMSKKNLIIAITQACLMNIPDIALYSTGEPLLYPHLAWAIQECKDRNLYVYITTNGVLLNAKMAQSICEAKLDSIKISIDAGNPKTYHELKGKDEFLRVLNNVKVLRTIRDEIGGPQISCAMIMMDHNADEIELFRELFGPYADDLIITPLSNMGGKIGATTFKRHEPCRQLWDRTVICYNGDVTVCCVDFDGCLTYGNILHTPLADIWNNKIIRRWRQYHIDRDFKLPMCGSCDSCLQQPQDLIAFNDQIQNKGRTNGQAM